MSSPFETFRKHRTYWMAGLVLLAILAFIVAPGIEFLMDMVRSQNNAGGEVVMRWSDGKVTLEALENVRMQHARTTRFLQALAREVIKAGGMPKVPGFRYDPAEKRVQDLGLPILETNRAVCQTILIGERAKQLGIEFNEAVIDDFFARFCDRKISRQDFDKILKETAGRELSKQGLYRQLSLELAATVMERIALAGVNYEGSPLVTPGSLWQNYLRLNQTARVEAFPVNVSEYVKEIKESPSESEIRSLYEAGAANFPSPNSPEPGFRRRYQANIEYVYASWNKLIEIEKAKISQEAIKAEYDRLVGMGGLQVPVDSGKEATAARPDEGQPPAPDGNAANATTPATESPSNPAPNNSAPNNSTPEPTSPAPSNPAPNTPAPEGSGNSPSEPNKTETDKATDSSAGDKGGQAAPANPNSQSRRQAPGSDVRLVAYQQDAALPPVVNDPVPPSDTSAAPAAASATQPAANASSAASPTSPPAAGATASPPAPSAPPMRTQTYEEAKESIARTLAMNVVRDMLQNKLVKIESEMNRYASDKQMARISEENKVKSDKPIKPLDLKKLAESEGLSYGQTGMTDGFRLASTPIGRSRINNQLLPNVVMSPAVELLRPVRSMYIDMDNITDPDFQEFVSWKIDEVQAYTPPLEDVRDEVIDAWKTRRARDLARDAAEKLADKVRKGGDEPWKSALDEQQQTLVAKPIPFSWMSPPQELFASPQVTFVQGLDNVGQEFMQRVFTSPAGQVTVAPNQALSLYYVVRVAELSPPLDELRKNFETSRGRARQLAFPEREQMFSEWYQNIERSMNVQWLASNDLLLN